MIYGYIRVSTEKQDVANQKYEIVNFAKKNDLIVDEWISETISSTKAMEKRQLGKLIKKMKKGDMMIASELSRIGRNLMQIMSVLHDCMNREIVVRTIKDNYTLGNDINSKVMAFAFGLSAEIERNLISQRTKEALARKKSEGQILGRPMGSKTGVTKLTGKEEQIKKLLNQKISISAIGRIVGAHRLTVSLFCLEKKLIEKKQLTPAMIMAIEREREKSKDKDSIDFDKAIELYKSGKSFGVVATEMKISATVLRTKMVAAGKYDEIIQYHNKNRLDNPSKTMGEGLKLLQGLKSKA